MLQAHEKYYRISILARSSRSLVRLLLHGVYRLLRLNRLPAIITHLNDRISPEFLENYILEKVKQQNLGKISNFREIKGISIPVPTSKLSHHFVEYLSVS